MYPIRLPLFVGCLALLYVGNSSAPAQVFSKHVVVAQQADAAEAGRAMLRQGGNAVDAAIATAFALAVTHPAAGNLGGGGFIVAFLADSGQVVTFDFREKAPAAATETMYLGDDGKPLPRHRAGLRAAGVPGTVRGLALAHARHGSVPWATLLEPAIRLARNGFAVSPTLARSLNAQLFSGRANGGAAEDLGPNAERLADFPESVAVFGKSDGTPWSPGDLLIQSDLAATLERIAQHGPDEFYRGRTAELIVQHMQSGHGLVTHEDLEAYQAKSRPPVHTTFRGCDVYGIGPPSSGGICVATALNLLEPFDLKADGPASPRTLHRVTEAMRRAFFVRATSIADPDVVPVPAETLTSKAFARSLPHAIGARATPSEDLAAFRIDETESNHTTHLSTMDSRGNAVALTYTLEEGYGCKSVVRGAGFLLNNEMGDFNLIPGRTDRAGRIGTPPNRIAPGKRMLSSQAPTIVLQDGKVRLVTGSPGGRTIPNTVLWILLNDLEFGLDPRACVDAPRTHHAWFPDVIAFERRGFNASVLQALEGMGHRVRPVAVQGDAHTIRVDPGTGQKHGVADRRRETSRAAGD